MWFWLAFVGWLVDGWGVAATERIYAAPDLAGALYAETGLDSRVSRPPGSRRSPDSFSPA